MSKTNTIQCIDCRAEGITTRRKVHTIRGKPAQGKRCATHYRQRRDETRKKSRATRWGKTYGITEQEYQQIYEHQGGLCFICRRATGKARALAVDHDHDTGYVRGLLCKLCNRDILGHARDDIEFFERCIAYLNRPPAFEVIGQRVAPIHLNDLTTQDNEE